MKPFRWNPAGNQSRPVELAWVNRWSNTPEIEALGRKYHIPVYGDVATGKAAAKPGQMTLKVVLDDIDRHANFLSRGFGGGAEFGFGIYQLVVSGQTISRELDLLLDPEQAGQASLLHLGESGSLAIGGGLLAVSGSIKAAQSLGEVRKFSDVGRLGSKLSGLSKWSGRLGILATTAAGGLIAWEYYRGGLTDRQFSRISSATVGGALGTAGGAWALAGFGAGIGTLIAGPPGGALGGFIGGVAGAFGGGWAGSTLFVYGVESYHEIHDKEMERKRVDAIYAYYGAK